MPWQALPLENEMKKTSVGTDRNLGESDFGCFLYLNDLALMYGDNDFSEIELFNRPTHLRNPLPLIQLTGFAGFVVGMDCGLRD
jgi:hypothetical protein